jgi:hypothetical protein
MNENLDGEDEDEEADASFDSESFDSDEDTDSYDSDDDEEDEDGDEEDDEEGEDETRNEHENENNNPLKITNSKKRELDTSSSCSNPIQLNTDASFANSTNNSKEVNSKKRIRKVIEDDSDEEPRHHKNINNHETSKKLIKEDEQRIHQNMNNKENSNIEKLAKSSVLNAMSGVGGGTVGNSLIGAISVNSGTNNNSMGNSSHDPSKFNKKKKTIHLNPIGVTSTTITTATTATSNMLPTTNTNKLNNLDIKKKKLEQNTNLNVLNAKQPQVNVRINNIQLDMLDSNEIEKDAARNSAESNSSDEVIIIDCEGGTDQSQISSAKSLIESLHPMPPNLPASLVELTNSLVDIFNTNKYETQSVWPNDFKFKLLNIYTKSLVLNPSDKSAFFSYLAGKLGKTKDNLVRLIRRINAPPNAPPQQPQQSNNNLKTEIAPSVNQAQSHLLKTKNVIQSNKPHNVQSSPNSLHKVQHSPQNVAINTLPVFSINTISDEFRANLVALEKNFKSFKLRNEETQKFFENSGIRNSLFQTDKLIKASGQNNKAYTSRIKDFGLNYLANAFEMNKDVLQKKFDQIVFGQKVKENEILMGIKNEELKNEVVSQMEKSKLKFANAQDQWVKNRASNDPSTVNQPMPKQIFEWSQKARDLLIEIVRLRLFSFRSTHASPLNRSQTEANIIEEQKNLEREKFVKDFLLEKILVLWPEGWMSLPTLYNKYDINRNRAQTSNLNRSTDHVKLGSLGNNNQNIQNSSTNSIGKPTLPNVINISSKNGKNVRIEAQNVNQVQAGIFYMYYFSNTQKHRSHHIKVPLTILPPTKF